MYRNVTGNPDDMYDLYERRISAGKDQVDALSPAAWLIVSSYTIQGSNVWNRFRNGVNRDMRDQQWLLGYMRYGGADV